MRGFKFESENGSWTIRKLKSYTDNKLYIEENGGDALSKLPFQCEYFHATLGMIPLILTDLTIASSPMSAWFAGNKTATAPAIRWLFPGWGATRSFQSLEVLVNVLFHHKVCCRGTGIFMFAPEKAGNSMGNKQQQPHSSCLLLFGILKDVLGIKQHLQHPYLRNGVNQGPIAHVICESTTGRAESPLMWGIQDACRGGTLCGLYSDVS